MNEAAYQAPAIIESFEALEVFGSAEGLEVYSCGNGSVGISIICVPA